MGCLQTPLPFLFVFLIFFFFSPTKTHPSTVSLANDSNNQTLDVHEIMPKYGFPQGLIPGNVESYTLHDSGSFVITLKSTCYIKFDRLVYFGEDIRGKMSYGAVHDLSGIEAKKYGFWFSVTAIEMNESDDTIKFSVGPFSENYPASHFADVRDCGSKSSLYYYDA